MLRIRSYLKPYIFLFIASVLLLFAQANFDLALPDYLSQIVNTGIQQSGIANTVPTAMRQQTMERLVLFMSAEDETAVRNAYTLIQPNSLESTPYVDTFPLLADEPIYILNDISQEELDNISTPIAQSLLVISALEQALADPAKAAQMLSLIHI